ncbi:MAG: phosphate ABC transporter substrate-binding protein PstS [Pseudobdellovibrionaceae bacterium]
MMWRSLSKYVDVNLLVTSLLAALVLFVGMNAFASSTLINGAGATFPEPIYTKWFSEFQKVDPTVTVNYQGIGSGGGIRQLTAGTVDFGASDAPMTEAEVKAAGKTVAHIPTVLGAVVVSYNLKLDKALKLDGPTIGEIFSGKINQWNDPKIAALNPGLKLPNLPIAVATRSDSSGTTAVFTDYLAKVSPLWAGKAGKTADWFKGSIGAKGNAGVAGLIKQAEGTVGYLELVYALENQLQFSHVKNKAGLFIEPSMKTVSAAAAGSTKEMVEKDFQVSITNSAAKEAYPISSFTWLLIPDGMDPMKGPKVMKFLSWALSEPGQKIAQEMNYAPLPKDLRSKILDRVKKVK